MLNTHSSLLAENLQAAEAGAAGGGNLLMILVMLAAIIFLFIVPARRQKKMQAELKARQESMGPGTEVMTNFGLFGTIVEVNTADNYAIIETAPGVNMKVHLQTVTTVVDESENASGSAQAHTRSHAVEDEQLTDSVEGSVREDDHRSHGTN